jgi:hypothetical protein
MGRPFLLAKLCIMIAISLQYARIYADFKEIIMVLSLVVAVAGVILGVVGIIEHF